MVGQTTCFAIFHFDVERIVAVSADWYAEVRYSVAHALGDQLTSGSLCGICAIGDSVT